MDVQEPRRLDYTVPEEQTGETVDRLLRRELHLSGTVIRRVKWLEDGILLDGVRVHTNVRVQAGQRISVRVACGGTGLEAVPGPLDIVYEDPDLLVLNKQPGVPCHPGPGHYADTLGNYVTYYYQETGIQAGYHPVHRLDRGTSGLLVIAKHPHAQEQLKRQLHTLEFQREYRAVCEGIPEPSEGTITAPIGPVPGSLMARRVDPQGQSACTHYRVLRTGQGRSLLQLELETGRTHQIRVHMAVLGHPLTGDFLYGVENPALIPRPALHSARIILRHPLTGMLMQWSVPLPDDMAKLL